jgi:hypothetical protein
MLLYMEVKVLLQVRVTIDVEIGVFSCIMVSQI